MVTTTNIAHIDMTFAQRLHDLRKQRGYTQAALADAIGIHVTQIRRYEAGKAQPTLDVLRNLAITLSTTTDQLVFNPDERGPTDDFALLFEALNQLDDHHQNLARELLEAITLRAAANRWQQPA